MKWKELISAVDEWANERYIYYYSDPQTQLLKAVSEMGELCDAEIKGSPDEEAQDAVGDVMVCLIIYCGMKDYDLKQCLTQAYEEIRSRTGKISSGGAFVKEE